MVTSYLYFVLISGVADLLGDIIILRRVCTEYYAHCTLEYNDFNKLVLPGRWWLQNLILRHNYKKKFSCFFEPFCPRLQSEYVKSTNMIKKNFKYAIKALKRQNLMPIWICWKSCKNSRKKDFSEKVIENGVFYFQYCMQKFLGSNFLALFSTDLKLSTEFCVLRWSFCRFPETFFVLILALFANFKSKL